MKNYIKFFSDRGAAGITLMLFGYIFVMGFIGTSLHTILGGSFIWYALGGFALMTLVNVIAMKTVWKDLG